jgi:hypothetical protein
LDAEAILKTAAKESRGLNPDEARAYDDLLEKQPQPVAVKSQPTKASYKFNMIEAGDRRWEAPCPSSDDARRWSGSAPPPTRPPPPCR